MKIERWCGWDLRAKEEVAFEKWLRAMMLQAVTETINEGVVRCCNNSQRWAARLWGPLFGGYVLVLTTRHRCLLLTPVHILSPLIWKCVSGTWGSWHSINLCPQERQVQSLCQPLHHFSEGLLQKRQVVLSELNNRTGPHLFFTLKAFFIVEREREWFMLFCFISIHPTFTDKLRISIR